MSEQARGRTLEMSPISKMTAMSGWSGLARRNARRTFRDRREAGQVLAEELGVLSRQGRPVGARSGPRRRAGRVGGRVAPAGAAGRVPGAQARCAAVAGTGDGRDRHRRRRGGQRQPGAQPRHQRRAAAGRDRTRNRGTTPPRAGLPRRSAARRHRGQDRDPRRRRHRHRCQHARRGARGAGRRARPRWWSRCRWDRASACRQLAEEADDVVCATMPPGFEAVGQVFEDFHQVTDDEVRELLATPTV